jgi:hypothetical protein
MAGLRFVNPVTTASGNDTGTTGVGVGARVGDGDETDVDPGPVDGPGVGLVVPHAATRAMRAPAAARRNVARVFTALS